MMAQSIDLENYSFLPVAAVSEVPNGERIFFDIGDLPVVLLNLGNQYFAIGDVCTHDDGPLGDGEVEGFEIICPRHGARFDVRTGEAVRKPAVLPTPWYPVRVIDGQIEIGVPKAPPG